MKVNNFLSFFRTLGLQSVIYKSYLTSALIPILFIELLLLVLYFGINQYMSSENKNTLYIETMKSLEQIVDREVSNLNLKLKEVSQLTKLLQLDHQRLFPLGDYCDQPNGKTEFGLHKNGAYYKLNNNGGASLYYSKDTVIGPQQQKKARCSESLDPLLKNIVDTNNIINQAYLNTRDNMNRLYPFMADAPAQYGPVLVMQDYNFYFLGDQAHNPTKNPVWTKAYLDPAGYGWMVSVIAPIYHDGKLEGVAGLDVTISTLVDNVLNIKLPWEANSFLIDGEGGILAMTKQVEELLGVKELTTHNYDSVIQETIHKPRENNIFNVKNSQMREIAKAVSVANGGTYEVTLNGEDFILKIGVISETGWKMLTLVNSGVILQPIIRLKEISNLIGYLAIVIILIFYVVFFMYLVRQSHIIARQIASPIETLTKQTSSLGKVSDLTFIEPVGIAEIDQLITNFNALNAELNKRSDALVEAKVREQFLNSERNFLEKIAKFDNLTQLFNRHELNRVLEQETKKDHRYQHGLGILLLDIDYFKKVNDNYGHQVGDSVLREFATIVNNQARQTDIVGRWGGEEFLIICPEIDMDGLGILAAKICRSIEVHSFDKAGKITVSIGCSTYSQSDSSVEALINNADIALYHAKRSGRNQWVIFERMAC